MPNRNMILIQNTGNKQVFADPNDIRHTTTVKRDLVPRTVGGVDDTVVRAEWQTNGIVPIVKPGCEDECVNTVGVARPSFITKYSGGLTSKATWDAWADAHAQSVKDSFETVMAGFPAQDGDIWAEYEDA